MTEGLGFISTLVVSPSDEVFLGGESSQGSYPPIVFVLPSGSNIASSLAVPDSTGIINAAAVGNDGTVFWVGEGGDMLGQELVYRIVPGSQTIVSIPPTSLNDGGFFSAVAISADGTAFSGGGLEEVPLMTQLSPNANSQVLISNPNGDEGGISAVAVAPNGSVIFGGMDRTVHLPLIYRLAPGSSSVGGGAVPTDENGKIVTISISEGNVAVLAGTYNLAMSYLIFKMPVDGTSAQVISSQAMERFERLHDSFIYNEDGLYDIRSLRPYDYFEQVQTRNALNAAGL